MQGQRSSSFVGSVWEHHSAITCLPVPMSRDHDHQRPWKGPEIPWAAPARSDFQSKVAEEAAKILSSYEGVHSLAGYDGRWRNRELELEFANDGRRVNWDGSTSWKWGAPASDPARDRQSARGQRETLAPPAASRAAQSSSDKSEPRTVFVFPTEQEQSGDVVQDVLKSLQKEAADPNTQHQVVHVLKPVVPTYADACTQFPSTNTVEVQTDIFADEWSDGDEDQALLPFGHPLRYDRDTYVSAPLASPSRSRRTSPRRRSSHRSNTPMSQYGHASPSHRTVEVSPRATAAHTRRHPNAPQHFALYPSHLPSHSEVTSVASSPRQRRPSTVRDFVSRVESLSPYGRPHVKIVREFDEGSGNNKSRQSQGTSVNEAHVSGVRRATEHRVGVTTTSTAGNAQTSVATRTVTAATSTAAAMTTPSKPLSTDDLRVDTALVDNGRRPTEQDEHASTAAGAAQVAMEIKFQHSPTRRITRARNSQNPSPHQRLRSTNQPQSSPASTDSNHAGPHHDRGLYRIRRYDARSTYGHQHVANGSYNFVPLDAVSDRPVRGRVTPGAVLNAHHQLNVVKGKPTRHANRAQHYARILQDGHTQHPFQHEWTFNLREYSKPTPTHEYLRAAEQRLGRRFTGNALDFGTFDDGNYDTLRALEAPAALQNEVRRTPPQQPRFYRTSTRTLSHDDGFPESQALRSSRGADAEAATEQAASSTARGWRAVSQPHQHPPRSPQGHGRSGRQRSRSGELPTSSTPHIIERPTQRLTEYADVECRTPARIGDRRRSATPSSQGSQTARMQGSFQVV